MRVSGFRVLGPWEVSGLTVRMIWVRCQGLLLAAQLVTTLNPVGERILPGLAPQHLSAAGVQFGGACLFASGSTKTGAFT